jgi:hypothetical protein
MVKLAGVGIIGEGGTPIKYNETEVIPADKHHHIAEMDKKEKNHHAFTNWDQNSLGREVCMKVRRGLVLQH